MNPSCLDSAYERKACIEGLVVNPVFPENLPYVTRVSTEWGQPPPEVNHEKYIHELVKRDIQSRSDMGKLKYGTRLQPNNGRDSLKDAYEEALDLCQYLRQAIFERDKR